MSKIIVEEIDPLDAEGLADLERWKVYGERLRKLDPDRHKRVLALARTYVSIYLDPEMSDEAFQALLREIERGGRGAW